MTKADQVRSLLAEGKSVSEIAKELSMRYQQVYGVAKQMTKQSKPNSPQAQLTDKEEDILKAMRDNEFQDALTDVGGVWVFSVIDNAGLDAKVARGVISSLVKKGLVEVWDNDGEPCISYTDAGKEIAKDYPTPW